MLPSTYSRASNARLMLAKCTSKSRTGSSGSLFLRSYSCATQSKTTTRFVSNDTLRDERAIAPAAREPVALGLLSNDNNMAHPQNELNTDKNNTISSSTVREAFLDYKSLLSSCCSQVSFFYNRRRLRRLSLIARM